MTTLKNNNARLTSALQESTANVEEWKRQLNSYKEENSRLKVGLIELEAGRGKQLSQNLIGLGSLFCTADGTASKPMVLYIFDPRKYIVKGTVNCRKPT